MNDFKAYGPNAWALDHGEKAIQTLETLIDFELRQKNNPNVDMTEDFKAISQMIDGEYFKDGAYPSILLASRTIISMGPPNIEAVISMGKPNNFRLNMYNQALSIIKKKAFRVQTDYSSGHLFALYILYHLRIMKIIRTKGLINRPSNINPKNFETDILACSFAAKQIKKYFTDENGEINIKRLKKQDDFHWNFNFISYCGKIYCGETNEIEIKNGSVKIQQDLPEILKTSIIGHNVNVISDHEAMQSNNAVITKLIVDGKNMIFKTNATNAKNMKAFKVKSISPLDHLYL